MADETINWKRQGFPNDHLNTHAATVGNLRVFVMKNAKTSQAGWKFLVKQFGGPNAENLRLQWTCTSVHVHLPTKEAAMAACEEFVRQIGGLSRKSLGPAPGVVCRVCDGAGYLRPEADDPWGPCTNPACRNGYVPIDSKDLTVDCGTCGGVGEIPYHPGHQDDLGSEPCPDCAVVLQVLQNVYAAAVRQIDYPGLQHMPSNGALYLESCPPKVVYETLLKLVRTSKLGPVLSGLSRKSQIS